ncbi:LysR family transcriptional regulator [Pseudofrankia saprophytica]|uniref:LysR family transcriptional regulator n=1 Tax=Pseudofrankia saprophytica TaxID=298655 RepID=UPI000234D01B|nr:LysR family transcriptional regulator [Pseudofrankia saprophytica]
MELRQLRYFVAVADSRHFGRAAEQLHIVQPAVSQQIRRLERELSVTLLDRSTRRVALTDAGRVFLGHAREAIAAADRAQAAARELGAPTVRTLRLGTSAGLGDYLTHVLRDFSRRQPNITVDLVRLTERERIAHLSGGDLDVAFVRRRPDSEMARHLRYAHVRADLLVAALPTGVTTARRRTVRLAELASLPVRLPPRDANPLLVDAVLGACREAGFEPSHAPASNDQDMLAMIAAGGASWTVFYPDQAYLLARQALPGIAFRRLASPPIKIETALVHRADNHSPHLLDLIAAARAVTPSDPTAR